MNNIQYLEKEIRKFRDEKIKIERELDNWQIRDKKQIDDLKSQNILMHNKEEHEIISLTSQMNSEIGIINSKIINSYNQENNEIKSNNERNKNSYIYDSLKHYKIEAMAIPGIGNGLANILHQHGYHTAADIDNSITRVPGIGDARASLLFSWKKRQEILSLQWITPKELNEGEFQIRQKYQSIRNTLNNDENNIRNQYNAKIQNIKKTHTGKYDQIQKQIYDNQINGLQRIEQSKDSIQNLVKEINEKTKTLTYQKSLVNSSYSEINLSNYLKYLIL